MQVTAAILEKNFDDIKEKLSLADNKILHIQIDLCDGVFGIEKTWLPNGSEVLPKNFEYEFDLMLNNWIEYVPLCVRLGAKRIVVHMDFFDDMDINTLIDVLDHFGVKLGVCTSNNYPLDKFIHLIKVFQERYQNIFIQTMGIRNVGKQGESFDDSVIERIKNLRQVFPDIEIQVDGSMNENTAEMVKNAGADSVVSGSYIFNKGDIAESINILKNL